MNSLFRNLLAVAAGAMIIPSAEAGVIAQWLYGSDLSGTSQSSSVYSVSPISTSVVTPTSTSGLITYSFNKASELNGATLTFSLTAAGNVQSISSLSANYTTTSDSHLSQLAGTWTYWVNSSGTHYTVTDSSLATAGSHPINFTTGGIALKANDVLNLQFQLSGASVNGNGSLTFDNLQLSAGSISTVPEPVHYALAVFGLIFVSTGASRWYRTRMKSA